MSDLTSALDEVVKDEYESMCEELRSYMIEECPVKTGSLRDSITIDKSLFGQYWVYVSGPTLRRNSKKDYNYAHAVVKGRGPVKAKNAKYLKFKIGNKWIYTKEVAGTKPNDFISRAVKRFESSGGKAPSTGIR